jgi:hypothetical protein
MAWREDQWHIVLFASMEVRPPGQITLEEIQRLIGELVLNAEAARLRVRELEAVIKWPEAEIAVVETPTESSG